MSIVKRINELLPEITEWRRDFHRNPELLYDTVRTAKIVEEKLREFGCDEVTPGIGRTGVVGVIKGKKDTSGKAVGLRADMDALPIHEETGLEYASQVDGKMHACGHDGHTAMLLGAAKVLCETRNFDGTVIVIFQPAEEGGAGAKAMCDDGLIERWNISEVYGMHNWPGQETGEFAIRAGAFFAAADMLEITINGLGGHGAIPHKTCDPVVIQAQVISALQSVVSRNSDPVDPIVVSITSVESSSKAHNVIPQWVKLRGTVRTMSKENRDMAQKRIPELVSGIAESFGGSADVNYKLGYPSMVNHETETEYAREAARAVVGDCAHAPIVMGGEDFAFMLEECPGAYICVGNGDTAPVHHPKYDFNDAAMPAGCSWWIRLAEQRLPIG